MRSKKWRPMWAYGGKYWVNDQDSTAMNATGDVISSEILAQMRASEQRAWINEMPELPENNQGVLEHLASFARGLVPA